MFSLSRRTFLGASLAGLGTACLFAQDELPKRKPKVSEELSFRPDTLFLTWQRDPTTTMTVQWVGAVGESMDTTVYYTTPRDESWESTPAAIRPYPRTDLKVFRAELTGLSPGTDYQFRIGKQSPIYRFRTMPAKATDTIHFVSGGDCGVNPHAVANNIEAARQDPMFVLIGGDLGYDNGISAATSLAFLRNYSKHAVGRGDRQL
jgi:phosphodiesterase/alkaline phosphatase D-like protein